MMLTIGQKAIRAQSLTPETFANAGGYSSTGVASLSWTFGQTVTPTFVGGSNKLTQGFQQPFVLAFYGCTNCVAPNFDPSATADDGSCITSCNGDFDFNGTVNVTDLLVFMSDFGTGGTCLPGDLNLDMFVNVTDLLLFMSAFGTNCS